MGLFSSITKLAGKALGSVSKFRSILNVSPSLSSLVLPPQVSMGLKVAGVVGDAIGVKIPSENDIRDYAEGKIAGALDDIRRPVNRVLGEAEEVLTEVNGKLVKIEKINFEGKSAEEVLQSIEWLL